jgi:hypothetical protein
VAEVVAAAVCNLPFSQVHGLGPEVVALVAVAGVVVSVLALSCFCFWLEGGQHATNAASSTTPIPKDHIDITASHLVAMVKPFRTVLC